jgi:phosphoglycolate phosphatase
LPGHNEILAGATIVFDLDGTLVDTAPDLVGVLNALLQQEGFASLALTDGRPMIGHGARALLQRGFAAAGAPLDEAETEALFARFLELYLARIADESRPFAGVAEALDELAGAGATLAVCTNKRTSLSLALLSALDLADRFAAIVGPDTAGAAKPDPRHLLFAIEAAGGRAERALMIGDSAADLGAARAASIPVALVSFGYTETPAAELGGDALLDHFGEIPAAARRLLARQGESIRPVLRDPADA